LLFACRILANGHRLAGFVAPPACLAQADFRVGANRQFLLATIYPVLEPPEFSASWLDQKEQAVGITHLVGLWPRLSIADGDVSKCHDFNPFLPKWPPAWGPLELTETHLAPKMAPKFARCGEKGWAQAGQMRCENPRISGDFVAFSGCCGKGELERVKGL
jgi:hypothetical protein